jgi:splicing factor 3B subunit 3
MFKLTVHTDEDVVVGLVIKYFDTIPTAGSLCLLKNGLLFSASEFGNHHLYQIAQLGDNEDEPEFTSMSPLDEILYFTPRGLRNLVHLDKVESLHPIIAAQSADFTHEDMDQIFVACGRGPRSSVRMLRHGLEVTEMAVSELPGNPNAVFSVKRHVEQHFDSFIIVSFVNATIVLSIGETVEEVTDSGFLATAPTLSASRIGDDSLLQVYPEGIRHIRADKRVNEWKCPGRSVILHATVNETQVVITLSSGELVYFELDRAGQLNEYTERMELQHEVCVDRNL